MFWIGVREATGYAPMRRVRDGTLMAWRVRQRSERVADPYRLRGTKPSRGR